MKPLLTSLLFFCFTVSISAQEIIRFNSENNDNSIEYGLRNSGNIFYPVFGETAKEDFKEANHYYEFIDYTDYVLYGIGYFYFDEFKKLNRFEYQSDITENTKFYLNDILLIDRHLLMKNYDDLLELGFKYNGKPKFDKTEIDLNSFYTISNGELKLIIFPYGRTGFPNTKSTPYVIIQKN
ncbi:MAG: hypothetical protein CMF23_06625 [Ignavibacteriae bacterium]|nr:hypothetical protein [Ignavibacteriota bacterium]